MNAPNSSTDRELESLRRAQRAHEPSMEEILASIRSIIADDKEPAAAPAAVQKPVVQAGPQIVYSNDSPAVVRVVAPAPEALAPASPVHVEIPAAPAPMAEAAAAAPKVVWEKPAAAPSAPVAPEPAAPEPVAPEDDPVAASLEAEPAPVEEEPFVSEVTDAAVSASFAALSTTLALQSSEMVERLVREMLRPMLKSWLDDNLPSLVERLVRAEIQRVARGGR
jgi:hypothetical protein